MIKLQKNDLRVQKTRQAIRQAFQEIICTTKYKDLSVSKITEKAKINRKTFYLHYPTLDDLLFEFQDEVINFILSAEIKCDNLSDMQTMIGNFFDFVSTLPKFHERLICDESYQFIGDKINLAFIKKLKERERGRLSADENFEDFIFTFLGANAFTLYRHWVNGGKKYPLEKLKKMTVEIMTHGLEKIFEKSNKNIESV